MKSFAAGLLILFALGGCREPYSLTRAGIARLVPAKVALEEWSIPILTYHRFAPLAAGSTTVTTATFEYHLNYLAAHGYTVIPLRSLVDWMRGVGPAPPVRAVVLTADDGHRSIYTDMLPLIRRYRVPVTLFVYPSAISNASYALSWDELKALKDTGLVDIQSHTYWHPNFDQEKQRLSATQYQQFVVMQFAKSKQVLEEKLHTPVDLLAWPFGIHDAYLVAQAIRAGYIAGFGLEGRRATRKDPIEALPRYFMLETDRGARFEAMLGESRYSADPVYMGAVIDNVTKRPIEGATVTFGDTIAITDAKGDFRAAGTGNTLRIRAPGYTRRDFDASRETQRPLKLELEPFKPKALYLSFFGIASRTLREPAIKLLDETELNALVIDVKGDRGMISFKTGTPLAQAIGTEKQATIGDIGSLMTSLKAKDIYTIARIVVFKDDPLATAKRDVAVKAANGKVWRDREHLAWTDPFNKEVWDYNIEIAVRAAEAGFDEIQFDYVRFPDAPGLTFSTKNTQENRLKAISGFLMEARRTLIPYNVFLSADVFGYVCWNLDDTGIGQRIEELFPALDYISPMLYPSSFQYGIPGYRNPLANPYEIVHRSLEQAKERTKLPSVRFRPWLQAFRDYAFDRRSFGAAEIRIQIDAAETFGSAGWMLWDPRNAYTAAGLKPETKPLFSLNSMSKTNRGPQESHK
jgi:peptidoglycan/xylan/chitin deacetylase (PgdA/CDA1 family)